MNQKNLVSLIILDVIVIFFAAGLIMLRYQSLTGFADVSLSALSAKAPQTSVPITAKTAAAPAVKENPPQEISKKAQASRPRNIGFSYRNSKVKKVEIIGSFNNWVPQPLSRSDNYTWKINLTLAPGEYAYNFIADGKPIKDPFNQKTVNAGRGFTSSYLRINPK